MTAAEVLRAAGCKVVTGAEHDVYDAWHDVIALTDETANGTEAIHYLAAFHEMAHRDQRREKPWLFWLGWHDSVRLWIETDAWARAMKMLSDVQFSGLTSKQ